MAPAAMGKDGNLKENWRRGGKRKRERCTGKLVVNKELGGISEGGERKGPWIFRWKEK